MQFLLGLLTGAGFFVALMYVYRLGQQSKKPVVKVDEEDQRKANKMRQEFEQLMSYDVTTALKGKKVTE